MTSISTSMSGWKSSWTNTNVFGGKTLSAYISPNSFSRLIEIRLAVLRADEIGAHLHNVLVRCPRVGENSPYPLIGNARLSARVILGEHLAVLVHCHLPREKQQFLGVNPSDVGVHPHRPGHVRRIGGKPSLSHIEFPLKLEGRAHARPSLCSLRDRRSPVLQLLR